MEPATPFTLFGYFDIILLSVIILFNILLLKFDIVKEISWKVIVIRFAILFIIFPMLSSKVEVANVYRKFEIVDGFNLLYIWLRWPTWWILGAIEITAFNSIINKKQRRVVNRHNT
ncbi:hypothetical protein [Flavisolibacter tropicus]|uniref:Uncharacterized protein n=1 Tax=Flavisolibacter tropicus TaxID=1492898 RepID=A0A172U0A0_9BACT|nr:hypothetical protein [Flavisolibacter tropicus]ANE52544.1 hypothetical protein SY85_20745 [Flavisolibacter tropicus]